MAGAKDTETNKTVPPKLLVFMSDFPADHKQNTKINEPTLTRSKCFRSTE